MFWNNGASCFFWLTQNNEFLMTLPRSFFSLWVLQARNDTGIIWFYWFFSCLTAFPSNVWGPLQPFAPHYPLHVPVGGDALQSHPQVWTEDTAGYNINPSVGSLLWLLEHLMRKTVRLQSGVHGASRPSCLPCLPFLLLQLLACASKLSPLRFVHLWIIFKLWATLQLSWLLFQCHSPNQRL